MKQAFLLLVFFSACLHLRAGDLPPDVTIQCTAITLPEAPALRFIDEHRLDNDAASGLRDLMILVAQKRAESVANPAVTTKSGQKATSEADTTILEVEPVLSPDASLVDINIEFQYHGKKLSSSFTSRKGEVKFLGAFDSAEASKNVTCFVFVRVRVPG